MPKARHIGDPCFACHNPLQENDDIVICPDCGTPYHRACWKEHGVCLNIPLHESGGAYQSPDKKEVADKTLPRICMNWGTENTQEALNCKNCGAVLTTDTLQQPSWSSVSNDSKPEHSPDAPTHSSTPSFRERMQEAAQQMGLDELPIEKDQDLDVEGEKLGDMTRFVKTNTIYYIPKFLRFREGHHISFNFPSFFFPQLYLAYRKMWPLAIIVTLIMALISIPDTALMLQAYLPDIISSFQDTAPEFTATLETLLERSEQAYSILYNLSVISSYLSFCLSIIFGLLGNHIYYRFVLRRVKKIRLAIPDPQPRQNFIRLKGGTNGWFILAMIGIEYAASMLFFLVYMLILML